MPKNNTLYRGIDWQKASLLFQKRQELENNKLSPSTREVLKILAAAGAVGMLFVFPKTGSILGPVILDNKSFSRWRTKQLIKRLSKQNYVSISELEEGKITVKITENGLARALTYELESMRVIKQKYWDRKWRVVIFDIPDKYKRFRDLFRTRLRQIGLYRLQESVYVSPYKCFDEVEFLRELYGVAFTVKYLLVAKIEDDNFLKRHFDI